MKDAELVQHLERLGANRGLTPKDLWERSGVERTIWYRIGTEQRRASRDTLDKLLTLKSELEKRRKAS